MVCRQSQLRKRSSVRTCGCALWLLTSQERATRPYLNVFNFQWLQSKVLLKNTRCWLEAKSDTCPGQEDSKREVKKILRITTKAILVNLGSAGANVSRQTVQQTLHTAEFHGCRPRRTPILQRRHTKAHLASANAHQAKEDFWSTVLQSDETNNKLFGHNDVSLI